MSEAKIQDPFDEVSQRAAELAASDEGVTFDYEEQNAEARSYLFQARKVKAEVERTRKAAKDEVLQRGRAIDSRAKEVSSLVIAVIDRHEGPLKAIEEREAERVRQIEDDLEILKNMGTAMDDFVVRPLDTLRRQLELLEGQNITADGYMEFHEEAVALRDVGLSVLRQAIELEEKKAAEQEELQRLRAAESASKVAEQERVQREASERAAAEARERAAEQRASEAAAAAEAAEKRAREAEERAGRAAEEERARAAKAEEERVAHEAEAEEPLKANAEEAGRLAPRFLGLKRKAEAEEPLKANAEHREAVLEAATEQLQEIIDNVLSDGHENLLSEAFARNIVERIDAEEPSRITIKF
jgi:hypothetical protein